MTIACTWGLIAALRGLPAMGVLFHLGGEGGGLGGWLTTVDAPRISQAPIHIHEAVG